ncbi:alanine racemase [Sphingomonas sp. MAH-20]|uniref:alanine racemase n=1 Tax=Sphingomonas horti TaxID=2682842 RepID=A0A6I4J053_9SPHN|nr:alanine racemase [Sphingomonas sp. CGMCC 1.13658]MBA2918486.1 alanine racemase [Sphingomonas sp. CGMCC 1.13658]MVO77453.1 alanine racemase [Sphingomonas horti]
MSPPHRLRLDCAALVANWRWLQRQGGGAACGAAVKADGYGLGAREVVARLAAAGCRDFFVSTWAEAAALMPLPAGVALSVLHGVRPEDMAAATALPARPVLNTPEQVRRWREAGGGACDVMIDTGINRLGIAPGDADLLDGLAIETLMSHLACADEDVPQNADQRDALLAVAQRVPHRRLSLANSAGVCLGPDYAVDLTRPGLALYGGLPRGEAAGHLRQVVFPEAQVLQRRRVPAGASVGYNATWTATQETEIAVLNIGYADGILRGFSGTGRARVGDATLPFVGRVSMDLVAIDATAAPGLAEGDWVTINYDLPAAAAASGLSQYELLTGLGDRFERVWSD